MKAKVAILKEINKTLIVDEVEIPPLGCGQVLVRFHASGICGAQISEIEGRGGPDLYLPHLLGHEGGGIVQETGPGVTTIKTGDFISAHWRKGRGIDAGPSIYKWRNCSVGGGPVTTFAELAVISENRLTKVGSDIPFEVAALMGCSVTTALGLINNEAQLAIGESIMVIGCGGIGLSLIKGAKMVSAHPIIAVDMNDDKLLTAKNCGADWAINSQSSDLEEMLAIEGEIDVCIDCTGDSRMIDFGFRFIGPGGRMILVGQPPIGNDVIFHNMRQHYRGKTLMDSQGGLTDPTADIPKYLELYRAGKMNLDGIITHRYPLEQINDAIEMFKSGQAGRIILEME